MVLEPVWCVESSIKNRKKMIYEHNIARKDSIVKILKLPKNRSVLYINHNKRRYEYKLKSSRGIDNSKIEAEDRSTDDGDAPTDGSEKKKKELISLKYDEKIQVYPLKQKSLEEGSQKVPKLPAGEFKPRKSLGQNFITDLNLMNKMCNSLQHYTEDPGDGSQVVELGCGIGSLTQILYNKYRNMTGIEIDSRAVSQLSRTLPNLNLVNEDVLQVDYAKMSKEKGKRLWIIGNLPFYITSQILLCMIDYRKYIDRAVVTAQWEVAKRIVSATNTKEYSILSVLLQLFSRSKILFKIPSQSFYPKPKVDAACIYIEFNKVSPFKQHNSEESKTETASATVNTTGVGRVGGTATNSSIASCTNGDERPDFQLHTNSRADNMFSSSNSGIIKFKLLKKILRLTFGQRRKKLKSSLESLLKRCKVELPEQILNSRPQNLSPNDFVNLVNYIYEYIYDTKGCRSPIGVSVFNRGLDDPCLSFDSLRDSIPISQDSNAISGSSMDDLHVNSSDFNDLSPLTQVSLSGSKEFEDRIWRKNKHGPGISVDDLIH